jgi:nitrate/nitrite transporter NarK
MKRRPSVLIIFLTVFIDLIGFGIVVPLVPMYSKHYGASGWVIATIIASYSAMQFVFSPIWGRLSDRLGRRPMLLFSTAGAALSYVLFAIGSGLANHQAALWVLLISRTFAGICGGNITVAQAYIADITPPQDRSKKMGLIGMAFGLGFILGPAIGGIDQPQTVRQYRTGLDCCGVVRRQFLSGIDDSRGKSAAGLGPRQQSASTQTVGTHTRPAQNRFADHHFLSGDLCFQLL